MNDEKVVCIDRSKPAPGSPVGLLMSKILEKNPGMGFEEARAEARRLLDIAAGKWNYRSPVVLSPAEQEARRARFATMATARTVKQAA